MPDSIPANAKSELRLEKIVPGVGTMNRWRILVELAKGEPLPAQEIARRVRMSRGGASRNLVEMHEAGLLERGWGHLYRIPQRFFVPGQNAVDFGAFVLRLDYPDPTRSGKGRRGNDAPEATA